MRDKILSNLHNQSNIRRWQFTTKEVSLDAIKLIIDMFDDNEYFEQMKSKRNISECLKKAIIDMLIREENDDTKGMVDYVLNEKVREYYNSQVPKIEDITKEYLEFIHIEFFDRYMESGIISNNTNKIRNKITYKEVLKHIGATI